MTLPDPVDAAAADEETEAATAADDEPAADSGTAAPTMTLAEQEALRRKLQDKFH
ncbi:hypothetical protein OG223_11135 [Streptomyces sp. NBC_01478]|uniref:hypothetical protein n=1 Tax=Streptomyces sp. NBC_01478 TaxID=2903882 RepID=UPI002E3192A2|nr:hypothetical protein [Streptomyces sp. NBC_01478]